jgi:hypothetical protein
MVLYRELQNITRGAQRYRLQSTRSGQKAMDPPAASEPDGDHNSQKPALYRDAMMALYSQVRFDSSKCDNYLGFLPPELFNEARFFRFSSHYRVVLWGKRQDFSKYALQNFYFRRFLQTYYAKSFCISCFAADGEILQHLWPW